MLRALVQQPRTLDAAAPLSRSVELPFWPQQGTNTTIVSPVRDTLGGTEQVNESHGAAELPKDSWHKIAIALSDPATAKLTSSGGLPASGLFSGTCADFVF